MDLVYASCWISHSHSEPAWLPWWTQNTVAHLENSCNVGGRVAIAFALIGELNVEAKFILGWGREEEEEVAFGEMWRDIWGRFFWLSSATNVVMIYYIM